MKKYTLFTLAITLILVLTACGSTPDKPEPTTAPEVTLPSSNPQQQFGLNVMVKGQDDQPIPWASGIIQISGSDKSGQADDSGLLVWENISDAVGELTVSAQGYQSAYQTLSLVQGSNDLTVVLELDPFQLNPASVCQSGQKINFVEDFEDGLTQDLDNITAPNWNLVDLEDRGFVLNVNAPGGGTATVVNSTYGNAVWQFDMKTSGVVDINMNWHEKEVSEGAAAGWSRYYLSYQPGVLLNLNFDKPGTTGLLAESEPPVFEEDTWHTFAIAYFQGDISVWVDQQKVMDFKHESPIESGNFGFKINSATEGELWFDNLIVCGLNAAYTP